MRGVTQIKGVSIKVVLTNFVLLSVLIVFGQENNINRSERIADCFGAVALPNNGSFSIAFPEEPGIYLDLENFKKDIQDIPQHNTVWLKFDPGFKGSLNLELDLPKGGCHIVMFDVSKENSCEKILEAATKVVLDTVAYQGLFMLDKRSFLKRNNPKNTLYIYFNYAQKHQKIMHIQSRFQLEDFVTTKSALMEEVDQRFDKTKPTYRLSFRDLETGLPVTARAIIEGSRMFDAMYTGSDLLFSLDKKPKFNLRLDAIGYFPLDTNLKISEIINTEHTVFLEPVAPGKQMAIDGIEFQPETADLVEGSHKKLTRVRDFLALNASLKIEVQGHVHQLGADNFWSKRLSTLRAKAVADYLINAGISKDRIESNGYGNTAMIFPEAQTDAEMQANRRVEIHIK